jgi:hypothetical protein
MRRLALFLVLTIVLLASAAAFDWWVDPFGQVWKPDALAAARQQHCLVSEELIGSRYWSFKRSVFFHRPTRAFVVGSSRVLKISGGPRFSNLGYPGSAPETILGLFRSLPARPTQTVLLGVEGFWFNARYALPSTDLNAYKVLEYLLARGTFTHAVSLSRQSAQLPWHRWKRDRIGTQCVLDRFEPTITWRLDGSRVWGWELDPARFPKFHGGGFTGNLETWRNGYFADWTRLDEPRIHALEQALALARARHWTVIGFPPPEPPHLLHVLESDSRLAPQWNAYLRLMPQLFRRYGFKWANTFDGSTLGCRRSDFPDLFHTDARCSRLLLGKLASAIDRKRGILREIG